VETARLTGLYEEADSPIFHLHEKRHFNYILVVVFLYLLIGLSLVAGFLILTIFLTIFIIERYPNFVSTPIIPALFGGIGVYPPLFAALRLASVIPQRRFADTLCVIGITYIVLELQREDAIVNRKADLLNRLNSLANNLLLMGTKYSGSDEINRKWMYDLFRRMSRFVRGCERSVIAPKGGTLDQLRQDMLRLGKIMVSGQYGSFEFQTDGTDESEQVQRPLLTRILVTAAKLVSVAIPVFVLIFMFTSAEAFAQLNVNQETVFYISAAWLILALDDLIGMGIVDKFLNLVRVSREIR
jgi:hypothetical protein